jgi:hypothetical protein
VVPFAAVFLLATTANARPVIKEPGAHPEYVVELEPHALLDWADIPGPNGEGWGLGHLPPLDLVRPRSRCL